MKRIESSKSGLPNSIEQVESDCLEFNKGIVTAFEQRAASEQDRFKDATDSGFWCCFCFQSREQVEEFVTKIGLPEFAQDQYIDGLKAARKMGVKLETPVPPIRKQQPFGKEYQKRIIEN